MFKGLVEQTVLNLGLEIVDSQIAKVQQLLNTLMSRHGVILVGGSGGGKSTLHQILATTLSDPDVSHFKFVVRPNTWH
jgi:hypothetical protein